MKTLSSILVCLFFITSSVFAQLPEPLTLPNVYYIAFYSDSGNPGHAFVAFGYEDEKRKMSVGEGAWGLYPDGGKNSVKSLWGEVPGKIKDDFARDKDNGIVIQVSEEKYNEAKAIKEYWATLPTYKFKRKDCLSFLIEIAKSTELLKLPSRSGLDNFPNKYVKKLAEMNANLDQF